MTDPRESRADWRGVLMLAEQEGGGLTPLSRELADAALSLSSASGTPACGVLIGHRAEHASRELAALGLHRVLCYSDVLYETYRCDCYADALTDAIAATRPAAVLIGGSDAGKSLAPVVATRFASGLTADCTELLMDESCELTQIRPAYGGNVMARIGTPQTRPQFATIRPGIMKEARSSAGNPCRVEHQSSDPYARGSCFVVLGVEPIAPTPDIVKERVLVVAGQGFAHKDDLWMVEKLAELLGGQSASTRALVEKGWMPPDKQIGLSGKSVRPELLIACGVSGSVQFATGMRASRRIIAINSDADAPIFSLAHQAVCGNLYEILPRVIEGLETMNNEQ